MNRFTGQNNSGFNPSRFLQNTFTLPCLLFSIIKERHLYLRKWIFPLLCYMPTTWNTPTYSSYCIAPNFCCRIFSWFLWITQAQKSASQIFLYNTLKYRVWQFQNHKKWWLITKIGWNHENFWSRKFRATYTVYSE